MTTTSITYAFYNDYDLLTLYAWKCCLETWVVHNQPNAGGNDGSRALETFQRNHPPTFKGQHDPDGAQIWLKEDVRGRKEIEFLELKQWNSTVTEYASKFVELAKYYPHYNRATDEFSKSIKFENGLNMEIKQADGYQHIRRFEELKNNCRIYKEDNKAHSVHCKSLSEKRGKQNLDCRKPYDADKGKQKAFDGKRISGGGDPTPIKCYRCGEQGHCSTECENKVLRCYKCGKTGHHAPECKNDGPTYFHYGEQGHNNTQCQKPKKEVTAQTNSIKFALSGTEDSKKDNLIRGTCFINDVEIVAIIDTGSTHSFISLECDTKLELKLSDMNGSMIIDIPASGSVTTTYVCRKCPLTIFDKRFVMDLMCLPLHQIDVILGINWLEFKYVHINCYAKTLRFPKFGDNGELILLSAKEVNELLGDEALMFASLQVDREAASLNIPVVCEFLEVFPDDISDLPPEREVEFSIDLVPGTSPVSMAPYRMTTSELNELKKQLEEMFEKKFIRLSILLINISANVSDYVEYLMLSEIVAFMDRAVGSGQDSTDVEYSGNITQVHVALIDSTNDYVYIAVVVYSDSDVSTCHRTSEV
ncbi:uncharacterized protein LOC131613648 [Vicia villosa]|uniref:uncharacterized protein LOC131613648 n=1 Tax=Vicia villosa TaxID=3911 RepID=UPI00273C7950|nr:uncharacterized protein LOC131613648 [Vicia villosa]